MTTLALTSLPLADSWDMHGGWDWAWMAPMMLGMVLFWGAIILGIVLLVRDSAERRQQPPHETALTVLDRRLAEGALSLDDYHRRSRVLSGAAAPHTDQDITAGSEGS